MAKSKGGARVVRRLEEGGHHGHHGGAWKVAYADFVTAMMAFFLMLWLLSTSSEDTLKGLAEYFTDASANDGPPGGVAGVLNGLTLMPPAPVFTQPSPSPAATDPSPPSFRAGDSDALGAPDAVIQPPPDGSAAAPGNVDAEVEATRSALLQAVERSPDLAAYRDSIVVERTPEGLRIQLLDRAGYPMFPSGSDHLYPQTEHLLRLVVEAIRGMPNPVSIRGHTDGRPFAGQTYDNWALSSDRANSTRRAMIGGGLSPGRIADVIGKGDAEHLFADPNDARNRRISIVLLDRPPGGRSPRG